MIPVTFADEICTELGCQHGQAIRSVHWSRQHSPASCQRLPIICPCDVRWLLTLPKMIAAVVFRDSIKVIGVNQSDWLLSAEPAHGILQDGPIDALPPPGHKVPDMIPLPALVRRVKIEPPARQINRLYSVHKHGISLGQVHPNRTASRRQAHRAEFHRCPKNFVLPTRTQSSDNAAVVPSP